MSFSAGEVHSAFLGRKAEWRTAGGAEEINNKQNAEADLIGHQSSSVQVFLLRCIMGVVV